MIFSFNINLCNGVKTLSLIISSFNHFNFSLSEIEFIWFKKLLLNSLPNCWSLLILCSYNSFYCFSDNFEFLISLYIFSLSKRSKTLSSFALKIVKNKLLYSSNLLYYFVYLAFLSLVLLGKIKSFIHTLCNPAAAVFSSCFYTEWKCFYFIVYLQQ